MAPAALRGRRASRGCPRPRRRASCPAVITRCALAILWPPPPCAVGGQAEPKSIVLVLFLFFFLFSFCSFLVLLFSSDVGAGAVNGKQGSLCRGGGLTEPWGEPTQGHPSGYATADTSLRTLYEPPHPRLEIDVLLRPLPPDHTATVAGSSQTPRYSLGLPRGRSDRRPPAGRRTPVSQPYRAVF